MLRNEVGMAEEKEKKDSGEQPAEIMRAVEFQFVIAVASTERTSRERGDQLGALPFVGQLHAVAGVISQ